MVRLAIAGGSGEVGREIVDALIATKKHEIILLTRKDVTTLPEVLETEWVQVDYTDKEQLTKAFYGVHTVLSFITAHTDEDSQAQKNLIDASVAANVKRFVPSEWATSSFEHMIWYAGKGVIRDYLKALNKDKKVLEYTLFQPGLFVNYFTHPHKSAKHVSTFASQIDFNNRRALLPEGHENAKITLTAVDDLKNIVVKAIEYEGEWPVAGGIKGNELSLTQLLQIGEDVRGAPFTVEKLKADDLKVGKITSTWTPVITHSSFSPEAAAAMSAMFLAGFTMGISAGELNVSDEWNQLFPEYKFIDARQFLIKAWKGKP